MEYLNIKYITLNSEIKLVVDIQHAWVFHKLQTLV